MTNMPTSFKQELTIVPRFLKKLVYGTAPAKAKKAYEKYNIPSTEEIMAYIPSSIPFAAPLVVITDCALYSMLGGPYPFTDICRYIILQYDEKAAVKLSDGKNEYDVLGSTLLTKNLAGQELVRFIHEFQERLIDAYPWAKEQRDTLAQNVLRAARGEMKTGQLADHTLALLDVLEKEQRYCNAVILLKGESIFRACDPASYQRFLNNLYYLVSDETKRQLADSQKQFVDRLIRDLGDDSIDFAKDDLSQMYGNLSSMTELSEAYCYILAYVCIRLGKTDQERTINEQICRRFGAERAKGLNFFKGKYYNARMRAVFDAIQKGQVPAKEQWEWTDSMGLTPLHYAILLKKQSVVEGLLEKGVWKNAAPLSENDEAGDVYDYNVLACCVGFPDRVMVFQKTSPLVAAQLKTKKALERRKWLKQRKLDLQHEAARQSRKMVRLAHENDRPDKEFEYRAQLETQRALQDETQEEIDEIEQAITDLDYEIQELTRDSLLEAADTLQRLRYSSNPFVLFMLRLYDDPSYLAHILFESGAGCRLYTYGYLSFVTPSDVLLDLPYLDEGSGKTNESQKRTQSSSTEQQQENQKDNGPIHKPFGNSWFSPEAHRSMKQLKEEFKALAKQYHPDRCHHARSTQIFQEILNERADILEQME